MACACCQHGLRKCGYGFDMSQSARIDVEIRAFSLAHTPHNHISQMPTRPVVAVVALVVPVDEYGGFSVGCDVSRPGTYVSTVDL